MRVFVDLPLTTAHHEIFLYEQKFSDTVISFYFDIARQPHIAGWHPSLSEDYGSCAL